MCEFDLLPGVPTKESLMLNFEKVFLRPPAQSEGQREGDITFSQEDLEEYANHVWGHANDTKIRSKHCKSTLPYRCWKLGSLLTA